MCTYCDLPVISLYVILHHFQRSRPSAVLRLQQMNWSIGQVILEDCSEGRLQIKDPAGAGLAAESAAPICISSTAMCGPTLPARILEHESVVAVETLALASAVSKTVTESSSRASQSTPSANNTAGGQVCFVRLGLDTGTYGRWLTGGVRADPVYRCESRYII